MPAVMAASAGSASGWNTATPARTRVGRAHQRGVAAVARERGADRRRAGISPSAHREPHEPAAPVIEMAPGDAGQTRPPRAGRSTARPRCARPPLPRLAERRAVADRPQIAAAASPVEPLGRRRTRPAARSAASARCRDASCANPSRRSSVAGSAGPVPAGRCAAPVISKGDPSAGASAAMARASSRPGSASVASVSGLGSDLERHLGEQARACRGRRIAASRGRAR